MTTPCFHAIVCTECPACEKLRYSSREHAKYVARTSMRGRRLHAYRCHSDQSVWHLGHFPWLLLAGLIGRDELDHTSTVDYGWSREAKEGERDA